MCRSFINSRRSLFLNPMYCASLDKRVALFPVASIRYMKLWKSYYCRWNPRMRPQVKNAPKPLIN